jgi:hypothetical protein
MEHAASHRQGCQEADLFAFVGIKCEVAVSNMFQPGRNCPLLRDFEISPNWK